MNSKSTSRILLIILFFGCVVIKAQVQNGNYYKFRGPSTPFSKETLEKFKKTKTIFFYNPFEKELINEIEDLKRLIKPIKKSLKE